MLTLKLIKEETDRVVKGLEKKHFDGAKEAIDKALEIDRQRRETQGQVDALLSESKKYASQIGQLMKSGDKAAAEAAKAEVAKLKEKTAGLQAQQKELEEELVRHLCTIPNIPNDDVPEGAGAKMARFQRALEAFFLEEARKAGYLEVQPPLVVNQASGYGTGQLPDKEGQMYHAEVDDLYLIPTAEVPVTNIFRDVILEEKDLPMKRCAYSACFRREAGAYGKDVRGLNRLHEFDKVEIVRIDTPEHSYDSLNEMLAHVEGLLQKLELPYRILRLCGGDMSFTSAICYDFEVWSAAQQRWLEVSSTSNFESYQANRLKCRYRRSSDKKIELCHTLNGSALALPRIVASLMENNQTPEGIRVPKALVPYCGFEYLDDKNF